MTALRMRARDFLTESQLIAVRQRSTLKGVALIVHAWALILGSIALVAWWPNPLTYLLAVGIVGSRQLGLAILMHDAAHGVLGRFDDEDAGAIAAAILAAPRSFMGRTSISGAIDFAMERFAAAKPQSSRRIIDVSGDGTNNSGRPLTEARDQAVAEGVTINGLAIINDRPNPGYALHTQPPGGLPEWYRQNVIGGPGSFLRVIDDFRSFSDAMTNKLVSEIVAFGSEERTASVR